MTNFFWKVLKVKHVTLLHSYILFLSTFMSMAICRLVSLKTILVSYNINYKLIDEWKNNINIYINSPTADDELGWVILKHSKNQD